MPAAKTKKLADISKEWQEIWTKFPSSKEDSERAVDCYVLGQDTACVFHSMRVVEMGLRELAKNLQVKLTHKGKKQPIEFADWGTIINVAKTKISQVNALGPGPKRQAKLDFYADATDHCLFMKDIWRNTVSHARKAYNDSESLRALTRAHDFMLLLARTV